MVDRVDEQLHMPGAEPHWQESYYFNWSDLDDGSFGLTRIGFHEGGGRADALVVMLHDGQPEAIYPAIGVDLDVPAHESMHDGVRVGDLTYELVRPLEQWHITLTGRTEVDLVWTAFMPAHDFTETGTVGDLAHHHFEQSGTVTGTVKVDGRSRTISGVGHRDKSWGTRNWSGTLGWEWISAQFGSDLAFNVSLAYDGGTPVHNGFVYRDGATFALRSASVDYEWDGIEHVPQTAHVSFTDTEGERFEVSASALAQVSLVKDELFLQETPAAFTLDRAGVTHQGQGVLEHTWHAGPEAILARMDQLAPMIALVQKATTP